MDVRIWRVGTGIGERGPVGKGRESDTQIPALQLHVFMEGKAGRSGGGLQSLAMRAGSRSLMGGKMTLRVGTTLGKSPRGSERRGLFRTGEPEGVSESGEFQRGLLCEPFPSRFEFWRNTKL